MHLSRTPRPPRRGAPRVAIALVAALAALTVLSQCSRRDDATRTFTGTMDATTIRVSAQSAGLVTKLLFDEGRRFRKGDTLAVIETTKLGYQLDQNEATNREIEQQHASAEAQLRAAIINRDNVKTRYTRFAALLQSGAVTQQAVDDLKTQLDAADEQLRAARLSLESLDSRRRQVASGRMLVEKQMHEASILAPIDGVVLVKFTEYGEFLAPGSPVCEMADTRLMWTKIYVAENQLPFVSAGKAVKLAVDGLPDRAFDGFIAWVSDRAEFTPKTIMTDETRTTLVYQARVEVQNPDGIFKIGMPVKVILSTTK